MKTNTNKPKAIVHGECVLHESKIPSDAVQENHDGKGFVIIADSEVTGNHHVIDLPKSGGVTFFTKEKTRYMRNTVPAQVRCVVSDRHTVIPLKAGDWQMGIAQEFDYAAMAKRNVRD